MPNMGVKHFDEVLSKSPIYNVLSPNTGLDKEIEKQHNKNNVSNFILEIR